MQGCTLRDSPAGQDLQYTYGGTDIEKFSVPGCRGRNSSLSLRDEPGRAFLPPDTSPRVDPSWLRRRPELGAYAIGLRPLGRMSPAVAKNLPLEVIPSLVVGFFLRP